MRDCDEHGLTQVSVCDEDVHEAITAGRNLIEQWADEQDVANPMLVLA
jgi:hypothetical protein